MGRYVRIASCAYDHKMHNGVTFRDNSRRAMYYAREAASAGADVVAFPEMTGCFGHPKTINLVEESRDVLGEWMSLAKELGILLIVNLPMEFEFGPAITTIVTNGSDNRYYMKCNPTIDEMAMGFRPGNDILLVQASFGRLGFATCFDTNFYSLAEQYASRNPDIVFMNSISGSGLNASVWARTCGSYVVGSTCQSGAFVVNPLGKFMSRRRDCGLWDKNLISDINLDYAVVHYDYNNKVISNLRKKYGRGVSVEHSCDDGLMLISANGELSMCDIADDVGLETERDYFERYSNCRQSVIAGKDVPVMGSAW